KHKVELEKENCNHVNERHDKEFASLLQQRVNTHLHSVASEIRILSRGPLNSVNSYSRCMVNGCRFHTQPREENRICQNSRVVVRGDNGSSMIDYFGILQEVLEVVYLGVNKRVLVFKCEWFNVDNANGLQLDKEYGSTSVNTFRKWYVDQPYILASQAKQVFYVPDLKLGRNWYVVESNDPRTLYNVSVKEVAERHHVEEVYQEEEPHLNMPVDSNLNQPSLKRGSVLLEVVDASTAYDDEVINDDDNDDDDDIDSTKSLSSSHKESPLDDCSDSE
ncbi:reverse transcriptase domain-containing protein, partial [Tanacetum coccineum]